MNSSKELFRRGLAPGAGAAVLMLALWPRPAAATDLHYNLLSPNFGGANAVAFQMAQYTQSLIAAKLAADAAAAKAATPTDPNQPFVNAIVSQLNGIVAQSVAQRIANSQNGQAGTIQSGSVTISYANSDGQLSVTIISPSGSTTLKVPAGM